jgi:hypothetical protein
MERGNGFWTNLASYTLQRTCLCFDRRNHVNRQRLKALRSHLHRMSGPVRFSILLVHRIPHPRYLPDMFPTRQRKLIFATTPFRAYSAISRSNSQIIDILSSFFAITSAPSTRRPVSASRSLHVPSSSLQSLDCLFGSYGFGLNPLTGTLRRQPATSVISFLHS